MKVSIGSIEILRVETVTEQDDLVCIIPPASTGEDQRDSLALTEELLKKYSAGYVTCRVDNCQPFNARLVRIEKKMKGERMVNVIELERPSEQQVRIGSVEITGQITVDGDGDDRITVRVHHRDALDAETWAALCGKQIQLLLVSSAAARTFVHEGKQTQVILEEIEGPTTECTTIKLRRVRN